MNRTNRAVNRILVFVVGLALCVAGTFAVLATVWSPADAWWSGAIESLVAIVDRLLRGERVADTSLTWPLLAVAASASFAIVVLIGVLARLGRRMPPAVLRSTPGEATDGLIRVRAPFVSDALTHSLNARDDVLATHVTMLTVQREVVVHISVTPRKNTCPIRLSEHVDHLGRNLGSMLGRDLAIYISVHSGIRAQFAAENRRLS